MEPANTKVEQVVWALSLILTMKRKAHSILPTNTKTYIKKKDGHGTRVAQNKKDTHIHLKAARNQSLA
jgi:hypothetical protein